MSGVSEGGAAVIRGFGPRMRPSARIEPAPTHEEAAAIMAALEILRDAAPAPSAKRSRWRLAGLLGHAPPPGMKFEGLLWTYSSWKEMV